MTELVSPDTSSAPQISYASVNDGEALNMGKQSHLEHDHRYDRADEFMEVVLGHWDAWEDGALIIDKKSGRFADPTKVKLTTKLNGEVMQSASTDDLVFGVAQVIAYFSQFYAFRPGDVISTGSPAGVGYGREPKRFMHPGDVIEVHADGIGTLSNPIAA